MMKLAGCICLRLTQFGAKPVIITVGERSSDGFAFKTEGVIRAVCDTAGNLLHTTNPLIKLHTVLKLYWLMCLLIQIHVSIHISLNCKRTQHHPMILRSFALTQYVNILVVPTVYVYPSHFIKIYNYYIYTIHVSFQINFSVTP